MVSTANWKAKKQRALPSTCRISRRVIYCRQLQFNQTGNCRFTSPALYDCRPQFGQDLFSNMKIIMQQWPLSIHEAKISRSKNPTSVKPIDFRYSVYNNHTISIITVTTIVAVSVTRTNGSICTSKLLLLIRSFFKIYFQIVKNIKLQFWVSRVIYEELLWNKINFHWKYNYLYFTQWSPTFACLIEFGNSCHFFD